MSEEPTTIDAALEAAYVSGQGRPHWAATLADFAARSQAVAAGAGVTLDRAYGAHPRARFDLVPAEGPARAIVAYLHAGYWQMRDKAQFRFLAPTFAAMGADVAVASYPLAPESGVAAITATVRGLVPALAALGRERHGRALPIVLCGHSAGAHLAVEAALAEDGVAAVIGLSGVYDLEPLITTSLNRALGLDAATARAASPVHRVGAVAIPALFAVGGGETAAFLAQSRAMHDAWLSAGGDGRLEIVGEDDHFSLLDTLARPGSGLGAAVGDLVARVAARG